MDESIPAREKPIPGVTGELIAGAARAAAGAQVHYQGAFSELPASVAGSLRPGDVVVTLGAGSIDEVGPALMALLGEPARRHA